MREGVKCQRYTTRPATPAECYQIVSDPFNRLWANTKKR